MDIIQLYRDYGVDFRTEGHKHCRPGWVNVPCPFCISEPGHEGFHLGYQLSSNHYVCWRCGWHPVSLTISKLTGISEREVKEIVKEYGIIVPTLGKYPEVKTLKSEFKLPSNVSDLLKSHRRYLSERRNFDPDELAFTWGIKSLGPSSYLDYKTVTGQTRVVNYSHRILIPFEWNGKTVSFDSRDVTDKSLTRYQACPLERELIPHKDIIYCKQAALMDRAVIVEGPTDAWRFGVNSAATSGIKFTPAQVRLIAKMFTRAPVCFDGNEPQAREQADKLVAELRFRGVKSWRVDIEGDPGSMDPKDAKYLVHQLITKIY